MTRRLPEGIRKLPNGRYQARYAAMRGGRSVQVSAGTYATLSDAKDARTLAMAQVRTGTWVDPRGGKLTVKQWSVEWIAARPSTNRTILSHLNAHILPAWGATRLEDVTTLGLQHWVNSLVAQGLKPATVRDYYSTFKQMLGQAVVYGKLNATPCIDRGVKLPAEVKTEPVILTVEDMALLEQHAPPRFRAMIHLGCWTGMRYGELAGLRWQDIEWERGTIHVQQAVKHAGGMGLPKNNKKRRIPVDDTTMAVLREHRRDFGNGTDDLLFTTARGNRVLDGNNWRKHVWAPLVVKCGLDPVPTAHDMRHAHAGHMVMQGMDWKVLCDRLGHHNPSFTMDKYGWARPDSHEFSLAALQRARESA